MVHVAFPKRGLELTCIQKLPWPARTSLLVSAIRLRAGQLFVSAFAVGFGHVQYGLAHTSDRGDLVGFGSQSR